MVEQRRMSYKKPSYLLIGAIVFALLPLLPTLIAGLIASAFGCTLNEANVHACVVFGNDIGEILYAMGLTFWLAIVTIQIGLVGAFASVIWFFIVFLKGRKSAEKKDK